MLFLDNRLTPVQAASHPFLARHVPFAQFLTTEDEVQGRSESRRSGVLLTPSQYTYRPSIDDDIRRQHLSSLDLLHRGTRGKDFLVPKRTSTPPVGRVVPLVNHDRSKSTDKEDAKCHLNQGTSERQTPETQVTQGRVLQGDRNSTQKLVQKSVSLKIEGKALPVSSNVLENKSDSLLHEPAGNTRVTEGKEFLLASKTKSVASLNIPVTTIDKRRCQRSSSEKLVDKKGMPNTLEFDGKPCQRNDALKDRRCNWLEGGMPSSTCVGTISMGFREQTEYNEETSSRTRIYRSKKPETKEDSLLQDNELSLSDSSSSSAEESSFEMLSEGQSLQASLSSDSYLPESYSEVETCRMSYATSDRSEDKTAEEYKFLRNTNKTKKRSSSSIKMSDIKNSSSSRKRTMLPDISSSVSEDFSSDNEITESKTQRGSSSKKIIKLHELEKAAAKKTTRRLKKVRTGKKFLHFETFGVS